MAKPILDIDIVISGHEIFPQVVAALERLGYSHHGDQGIPEREAFKPRDAFTPRSEPPRKWMTHHLYVCPCKSEPASCGGMSSSAMRCARTLSFDKNTEK